MKLKDTRENYYYFSGKVSDIVRNLGFAGIAIIWIFKYNNNGTISIPEELIPIALIIVIGLISDLFQYLSGTIAWGCYNRYKEIKDTKDTENFTAPRQINWATIFFFYTKIVLIGFAYYRLLKFLYSVLS